ncbi:MAG: TIGR00153 family protein [candidate division KSB1 bacterium]|nr:TIGR00153 family protein [candidate division KSB1 bacterium]
MRNIANLFGRSPFSALQKHMEEVMKCCEGVKTLFEALKQGDQARVESIAKEISENEHKADLIKNDIRNHIPKSLFMPVDRGDLLEILAIQDGIADRAEDVGVLLSLRPMQIPPILIEDLDQFLDRVYETTAKTHLVIQELDELLETTFGGAEAEKVKNMIDDICLAEHEADLAQQSLFKKLLELESELSYLPFILWMRLFETVGDIANRAERLANRIRILLILD